MKPTCLRRLAAAILAVTALLAGMFAYADPVEDLVEFAAGATARADEVNGNFSAVAGAVNDNDARVAALEAEVADLRNALEAMTGCPTLDPSDEMVKVGGVCIDKYEASIWDAPVGGNQIIGIQAFDYCNPNGQDCDNIYARSVAGVEPAVNITWFQAQQALVNSGKRLPTNAEWQMAVTGTPDPGDNPGSEDCNTNSGLPVATGQRENCVSRWGIYDMVGNLPEMVADWDEDGGSNHANWGSFFGDDDLRIGYRDGARTTTVNVLPSAVQRGGGFGSGTDAGRFAVTAGLKLGSWSRFNGFRGAR